MTQEAKSAAEIFLPAANYDLAATLASGQVFRWQEHAGAWTGVLGKDRVRLIQKPDGILAQADGAGENGDRLREFLQTDVDLERILKTFPDDEPMNSAVAACRGLRILRQEPWECLASFILSATKQIVQIRQIVASLCECFGERAGGGPSPENSPLPNDLLYSFPSAERIAGLSEADLRSCKMGFRAPHLLGTARRIAEGKLDLGRLSGLSYGGAQAELMTLRGVGTKIADCVLLFACGFDSAFPVDVWIERALRTLYFPRRRLSEKKLLHFAGSHFGPHAGYAQQYLFHYMRIKLKPPANKRPIRKAG